MSFIKSVLVSVVKFAGNTSVDVVESLEGLKEPGARLLNHGKAAVVKGIEGYAWAQEQAAKNQPAPKSAPKPGVSITAALDNMRAQAKARTASVEPTGKVVDVEFTEEHKA